MSNSFVGASSLMHDRERPQLCSLAQEILVRLTDGQTVKSIAYDLGLTRDVVEGRVRSIYRRFRVEGVDQLVHAAIREGWIMHHWDSRP